MAKRAVVALALLAIAHADDVPTDPVQAHVWADRILQSEFSAAYNRFIAGHPVDRKPGTNDHTLTTNAGDRERWIATRDAFKVLDGAMRRAGY
jgi:hypothetical protein